MAINAEGKDVRSVIKRGIKEHRKNLVDIKNQIENELNIPLKSNHLNVAYIEQKYMKYCTKFWLQELDNYLKGLIQNKNRHELQTIAQLLNDIQNLNDMPPPLNQVDYYQLIKNHTNYYYENEANEVLSHFKDKCGDNILSFHESTKMELQFLRACIGFLKSTTKRNQRFVETVTGYCNGSLPFYKILDEISNLDASDELQANLMKAGNHLKVERDFFFSAIIKEELISCIVPVAVNLVHEQSEDPLHIIEVKGNNIAVSETLEKIHEMLETNPDVKEVRFIAKDIVHIDADLDNDFWHGKNVVVYTGEIKVDGSIFWNISGKNNTHNYENNAGTGDDGDGKAGADGYAGESGGNVLIQANIIHNAKGLTIISNGGDGSRGQDGGDGEKGQDGVGITQDELKTKFPSPVKFSRTKTESLWTNIVEQISSNSNIIKEYWQENENNFINVISETDNEITFSFCNSSFPPFQAFFLHNGADGEPGGKDGECGIGGDGGISGNIETNFQEIEITAIPGESGQHGSYGRHGDFGENGCDAGYVDYRLWRTPIFYEGDKNTKLKLEYYDVGSATRVYCPYKKKYAEIIVIRNEHTREKQYQERTNTARQNHKKQRQAYATRQKTISKESIIDQYSDYFAATNTLQNLTFDLENNRENVVRDMLANQMQREQCTKKLSSSKMNNNASCNGGNKWHYQPRKSCKINTFETRASKLSRAEKLIENLKTDSPDWKSLKGTEFSNSQLQEIFKLEHKLPTAIRDNLLEKYRFALFQKAHLEMAQFKNSNQLAMTPITAKQAAAFLIETDEPEIDSSEVDTVYKYIFEDSVNNRTKIADQFRSATKLVFKSFVLEIGASHTVASKEMKELFSKYDNYAKLVAGGNRLTRLKHELDQSDNNDAIVAECLKYIQSKGIESVAYMQLIAHLYKVNIRKYRDKNEKEFIFDSQYNETATENVYILLRDAKYYPLRINQDYLSLIQGRKRQNEKYSRIFKGVDALTRKQDFDSYAEDIREHVYGTKSDKELMIRYSLCDESCEKEDIRTIIGFLTAADAKQKREIQERLSKISLTYADPQRILHSLAIRFCNEGMHVSYEELYCLVNSILAFIASEEVPYELDIYSWIIAAHPQNQWIDHLVLLSVENTFKIQIITKYAEWLDYLTKIENKKILVALFLKLDEDGSITIDEIKRILCLLSNISDDIENLSFLRLIEWPYALRDIYWTNELKQLTTWEDAEEDLQTAAYYILSIENKMETSIVQQFINKLKDRQIHTSVLLEIISNFHNELWTLGENILNQLTHLPVTDWVNKMKKNDHTSKDRNFDELISLMDNKINDSLLADIRHCITSNVTISKLIQKAGVPSCVADFKECDFQKWRKIFQKSFKANRQKTNAKADMRDYLRDMYSEMLAVINKAVEIKRKYKLRDTQKLCVAALLMHDRNILAQVSTGEGKSLIVMATAIIKVLSGEKVDIITSSSILAKRDAEENTDIYELFGIKVAHNSYEDTEERKRSYFKTDVVYGDLSNFQRDYLLDRFYGNKILGERNCENVIIDEVDSMLLDKGNNMLYLSHEIAGLDVLQSIYIYIWQWINRPNANPEEVADAFDETAIRDAVLNEIYGVIKRDDIKALNNAWSEQHVTRIWKRLVNSNIIDDNGKLNQRIYKPENELSDVPCADEYINYFLTEITSRPRVIPVPSYLKPFVEIHLEAWIRNAIIAYKMQNGHDYVVDIDRTGTCSDRSPNIRIIDRDTGTDQTNSQWDEALHQFLQLKHGCKLSVQNLKAVFISNVSYLKLYKKLYGLTGTLGSQKDRELLKAIHDVDFIAIPRARPKQFREERPIILTSKADWINQIVLEANVYTESRSVLIICETVNDVESISKAFNKSENIHTYSRDYEKFSVAQGDQKLQQQQIIIATNLAGRGTDFKITDGLNKAGGLHVCLTYLPNNSRVEEQAMGRAARSAYKGSGQLIINVAKPIKSLSSSKILVLKNERDCDELCRLSDIKSYYETQIKAEEACFAQFKAIYENLSRAVNNSTPRLSPDVQQILMRCCLDKWAFWLDKYNETLSDLANSRNKYSFEKSLKDFISQMSDLNTKTFDDMLEWVQDHPAQMIKLGKCFALKGDHEKALKLFQMVIDQEPSFSEAAHYYKAFSLASRKLSPSSPSEENEDKQKLEAIDDQQLSPRVAQKEIIANSEFQFALREAARLFDQHKSYSNNYAAIISLMKENIKQRIVQVDGYEKQQEIISNTYSVYIESINDILGHVVTPQYFNLSNVGDAVEFPETQMIYNDLVREGVLRSPRLSQNHLAEKQLKEISYDYAISGDELKAFLTDSAAKKPFDDQKFRVGLKRRIKMPSRGAFWKKLISQDALTDEIKFIFVNNAILKKVDPSFMDEITKLMAEGKLQPQMLKPATGNQIYFYPIEELPTENIFVKADFKSVAKSKYNVLKSLGIFTFNKTASVNVARMENVQFHCFDKLTHQDFTIVNILDKGIADKIIKQLLKQNIIKKDNSQIDAIYRLQIPYNQIGQIQLTEIKVYENVAKTLLSVCFSFKMALEKLIEEVQNDTKNIHLNLVVKPHSSLYCSLCEYGIVEPVITKCENIHTKLNNIYKSRQMPKEAVYSLLFKSQLIPSEYKIEKLIDDLIEKKWLVEDCEVQNIIPFMMKEKFYMINVDGPDIEPLSTENCCIEKTIKRLLKNRQNMSNNRAIDRIANTLTFLQGSLYTTETLTSKIKPLTDFYDGKLENIDELNRFSLNGLDHLFVLKNSWKLKRFFNISTVLALGMVQVVTSVVLLTRNSNPTNLTLWLCEGIGDIYFATTRWKSGNFTWKYYIQHKMKGELYRTLSTVLAPWASKGLRLMQFGSRVFGVSVSMQDGFKTMHTIIQSRHGGKSKMSSMTEAGFNFGSDNYDTDLMVHNYAETVSNQVGDLIREAIDYEVELHEIISTLKQAYQQLGNIKYKQLMVELRENFRTEVIAENLRRLVEQQILNSFKAITKDNKDFDENASELLLRPYRDKPTIVLGHFINELLKRTMHELKQKLERNEVTDDNRNDEEVNIEKDIIKEWSELIRKKTAPYIKDHIVGTIREHICKSRTKNLGKTIRNYYKSLLNTNLSTEEFDERYNYEMQSASNQVDDLDPTDDAINKMYKKYLPKILGKLRNPQILADIIRENIPMDKTCTALCVAIMPSLFEILEQKIEYERIKSADVDWAAFKLVDKNNSFFETILDTLRMDTNPTDFRADIADCIENNTTLQTLIDSNLI